MLHMRFAVFIVSLLISANLLAFEPFEVKEIRVEGLQRISLGTVYNYLPIEVGQQFDSQLSSEAIRDLYSTGFFKDVVLELEGEGTLVVFVAEQPSIASIEIEGNDELPSDQLMESLNAIGLAEGRIFNRSNLEKAEQEIKRHYLNVGKYSTRMRTTIKPRERNRVDVLVEIQEGDPAQIQHVNIVGNKAYKQEVLLAYMQLGATPAFSWLSNSDQYSKAQLSGDLERLTSLYMDNGYIKFNIESTQISITPDKRHVYITINIHEGEQYTVRKIDLSGRLIVPREEMRSLITLKEGEVFSRREVLSSTEAMSERLGDIGYAFANVNPIPNLDEEKREVDLVFAVDPGNRTYVRRIRISGNKTTSDEVMRREMRQMESAWISTKKIKRSRTRMDRLGYFDRVNVETPPVAGSSDQVDVDFQVTERETFGSLNMGLSYGDANGVMLNASVEQQNFLGTGNKFNINFSNDKQDTIYRINIVEPYYTLNGVSRGYSAFFKSTDTSSVNITDFSSESYGGEINFTVPFTEFDSMRYALGYERTTLAVNNKDTAQRTQEFCTENASVSGYRKTANPDDVADITTKFNCLYDVYKLDLSYSHDTRNRTIFPSDGSIFTLGGEVATQATDEAVSFYKGRLRNRHFFPLNRSLTLSGNIELSYAQPMGDSTILPPFEYYFAGGIRSVRGYRTSSLGYKDSNGDPEGGDARALLNLELLFPPPFSEGSDSTRLSTFIDGGNVFDTTRDDDYTDLRYSFGVGVNWFTPVGPLVFSYAKAVNPDDDDETEAFQFTMGMAY